MASPQAYDNPVLEGLASNIPANLGCYMIGCVLNLILMAILGMQGLDYYKFFPNDSTLNKSIVGFLMVAGLFQSACFFEMLWTPLISGFGDLKVWNNSSWTWWSEPVVSSIISVVLVAVTGMTIALAFGIACTYFLSEFVLFTESNRIQSKICASSWLAFSTATDIWISLFLVIHLLRERRRLNFNSTEMILGSILNFTMKTAAFTSVWVTINLILYAGVTHNFAWSIFQFNFGKIYSISVLYTLLSRIDVRKILSVHNVQVSSSRGRSGEAGQGQSAIHIRTEVEREYEMDDKLSATVSPGLDRAPSADTELGVSHKGAGLQDSIVDDDRSTRALRFNVVTMTTLPNSSVFQSERTDNIHDVPMRVINRPFPPELDEVKVEKFIQDYQKGDVFTPIEIWRAKNDQGQSYYFSFGGCHRFEAAKRTSKETIRARIVDVPSTTIRAHLGSSSPV
ncbi:hypothetical protein E3P89_01363 [Wallemia ichthyophaga]|uniref:Uncharacterized protein n=2 Tax=Wallemia ichthyophaga TaxID=245174 RepID=A0A4T0HIS7_WALIC|nr:hypothetical protein E3P90_01763 [Wallemia ichthyophaga]TIB14657.1 hypothetical protein E3P93_01513 [Wallemia ichthyophaga]TIB23688.1 hypothetical protein E3P89_01363 [Wallemia ichthyophaga]TIB25087.1 hypothetical protein E3P88_01718 [Wallemia ichthyophaga]TIB37843.1 hypothetical protein E3P86_02052 [Wallemia ichthyophaga]